MVSHFAMRNVFKLFTLDVSILQQLVEDAIPLLVVHVPDALVALEQQKYDTPMTLQSALPKYSRANLS